MEEGDPEKRSSTPRTEGTASWLRFGKNLQWKTGLKLEKMLKELEVPFSKVYKEAKANFGLLKYESEDEREKGAMLLSKTKLGRSVQFLPSSFQPDSFVVRDEKQRYRRVERKRDDDLKRYTKIRGPRLVRRQAAVNNVRLQRNLPPLSFAEPLDEDEKGDGPLSMPDARDVVQPSWAKPYEEQIAAKAIAGSDVCRRITTKAADRWKEAGAVIPEWFLPPAEASSDQRCIVGAFVPSPQSSGYRNKCEFTCGTSFRGNACIGYIVGGYWGTVEPPYRCRGVCNDVTLSVLSAIQDFLEIYLPPTYPNSSIYSSEPKDELWKRQELPEGIDGLDVWEPYEHIGFWRTFTIRTSQKNDVMIIVQVQESQHVVPFLPKLKKQFVDAITDRFSLPVVQVSDIVVDEEGDKDVLSFPLTNASIVSIVWQHNAGVTSRVENIARDRDDNESSFAGELLFGQPFLEIDLLEYHFIVSPDAFFQVNSDLAELLYGAIQLVCRESRASILFDVFCGTGSIGLCCSRAMKKIVGIECVKSAIGDARRNAARNSVENVLFVCGSAENVLLDVILEETKGTDDVVAVVDPPRAGLPTKTIYSLRKMRSCHTLVYVSCNPKTFEADALKLTGPPSNRAPALPFRMRFFQCFDMFPHTDHFEICAVFERVSRKKKREDVETMDDSNKREKLVDDTRT